MTKDPDIYFIAGCGRCEHFATPQCKVRNWSPVLQNLREIVLSTGVTEEAKWGVPCYTHNGKNIFILSAFKEYCAVSFFKGALLKDPYGILIKPTENSNADRSLRFTSPREVSSREKAIKEYIKEAIAVEEAGLKVPPKPVSDYSVPEEFTRILQSDPALQAAFEALTPGRQKGYLLHFAQPKQSTTRTARIEKCIPKIMDGIGLNDRG